MIRRSTFALVAGMLASALAAAGTPAGDAARSRVLATLVAGRDASALVAEDRVAVPGHARSGAVPAAPGAGGQFATALRNALDLIDARVNGDAFSLEALDRALEAVEATRLLLETRSTERAAGHDLRLQEESSRSLATTRTVALETAATDAVQAVRDIRDAIASNGRVPGDLDDRIATLRARLASDRPATRALGNALPQHRPRLAPRAPELTPVVVPGHAAALGANAEDLTANADGPLAPAVAEKARSLGYDYVRIFDFVRSEVATEWYAGAQKGAAGTLATMAGNDVDQASLLIALLRASGAPTRYVRAVLEVPSAELGQMLAVPAARVGQALSAAGIANEPVVSGGALSAFRIEHVYVDAFVPYANYRGASVDRSGKLWIPLAPALKRSAHVAARDAVQRSGIVVADWVDAWLRGPQSQLPLVALRDQVSSWLFAQSPPEAYDAQLARVTVDEPPLGQLPAGLPYPSVAVTGEWPTLPAALRQRVRIELRGAEGVAQLAWTAEVASVAGKRITVAWIPATADDQAIVDLYGGLSLTPPSLISLRAQLVVAGSPVATATQTIAPADAATLSVRFDAPSGEAGFEQSIVAGAYVAIAMDVAALRPAPDPANGATNGDVENDAARLLAHFGARYLGDWLAADDELARLFGVRVVRPFPSAVLVMNEYRIERALGFVDSMTWSGVGLDAAFKPVEPIVASATATAAADWLAVSSLHASALEHAQFEAQWRVDSVSADRLFSLATAAGIPVVRLLPSDNASALTQHPVAVRNAIAAWLRSGYSVDVPETPVTFAAWRGSAWRAFDRTTGESGYFISGGLAGGMTAVPRGLWYYQDLVAALANPDALPPNTDPLSGAIVFLDRQSQDQRGTVGTELPLPLIARVRDRTGRPVVGASVRFVAGAGGGRLMDAAGTPQAEVSVITDGTGSAFASMLLPEHIERGINVLPADGQFAQTVGVAWVDVIAVGEDGEISSGSPYRAFAWPGPVAEVEVLGYNVLLDLWPSTSYIPMRVMARDRFENSVANASVQLSGTSESIFDEGELESCEPALTALATGPRFFEPGACPSETTPNPNGGCERNNLALTTRASGAEFFLAAPDIWEHAFKVLANVGSVEGFTRGSTRSYPGSVICASFQTGLSVLAVEFGYVGYFGSSTIGLAPGLEATRPNTPSPTRNHIGVWYSRPTTGDPRVRWQPAPAGSFALETELTNGEATDAWWPSDGIIEYSVVGGAQPGFIEGTWRLMGGLEPGQQTPVGPFSHHRIAVIDLKPPVVEPQSLTVDAYGSVEQPMRAVLDFDPSEYIAMPWEIQRLENHEVTVSTGSPFGYAGDDAVFPRGWLPDAEKDYSIRVVINDGTPFRMESPETPLQFTRGLISGYGIVPDAADPLAALNLVQGEYPREINLTEQIDISTGYTCAADKKFGFVLAQAADVTMTIRSLDAQGEPTFEVQQLLNHVRKDRGYSDVDIAPSELPFGVFQYDLHAVSVADGTEQREKGLIVHQADRDDSLTLAHSFVKGVDLFFGHPVVSSEDVKVAGRGPGLSFSRTYSGNAGNRLGPMGWGWSSSLDSSVTVDGCGRRFVQGSAGQAQPFVGEGSNGDGSFRYRALNGYHGTLVGRGADYDFYAKDGTRYHFAEPASDGSVRLSFVEDPDGNRVTYEYVGSGADLRVTAMRDSAGRSLTFEYRRLSFTRSASGRPSDEVQDLRLTLSRVRGPGGIVVEYDYDANGNLIVARRNPGLPGQQLEEFAYQSFGSVLVPTPQGGENLQFLGWRLETATDALSDATREYLYQLQWAGSRDPLDITAPVRWTPELRVVELTEPDAGKTRFTFNGLRGIDVAVTTVVKDARSFDTTYTMNRYGAAVEVQDPAGTTRTEWDMAAMQPRLVTDAVGTATTYTYDEHGNRASESIVHPRAGTIERAWTYEPPASFNAPISDRIATARDGRNIVTAYSYDQKGHRTSTVRGGVTESDGYDSVGDHASHTDGRGKTWTYRYDQFGQLREQRDPFDHFIQFAFDERGRKLSETDANGHETTYTYDERDREVARSLPQTEGSAAPAVVRTEYDDSLRTRTDRDANGHATVTTFDLMGRAVRVRNAAGDERSVSFDQNGNKTSETDFRGNETTYTYDAANRLVSRAEPEGRGSAYEYDALGHVMRETVGSGAVERVTEFDYEHPLYARTSTRRKLATGWLVTAEEFDANGNRTALVDPLARRTVWTYDGRDRPITESGPLGYLVTTTYDASDHPETQTTANTTGSGDQLRRWSYDDAGRQTSTTDATGALRETEYDAKGNITRRIDARRNSTTLVYDARDRVIEERGPAPGQITRRRYDAVGNVTGEDWANGRSIEHTYDELNRRTQSVDNWPDGPPRLELLAYDEDGHVTSRTDANNHVTTTEYDGLGRKRVEHRPLGRDRSWTYNVHGDVVTETDARNFTWTHVYDEVGRRIATTTPNVTAAGTSYTTLVGYDSAGNVLTQIDANGNLTSFGYDDRNRRTSQADSPVPGASGGNVVYTQGWSYDTVGNVLAHTDRRGIVTTSAYDRENRPTSVTRDGITATSSYDAEGNVRETRDGAGHRTVFTYDEANRKLTEEAAPGTSVAATTRWTWTPLGDVASQTDGEGRTTTFIYDRRRFLISEQNAASEETTYTNDGNGQRTAMIRPNGANFDWRYDYDAADRLERVTDPLGHSWNYGYDAGDHRTSIRDANGHETTFTFDELGRAATHAYPGGATWAYAYDGSGNRTRADSPNGVTMSSTYDALNRLLRTTYSPVDSGGASETTQRYDGNGNLVRIADAVGSGERAIARTYDDRDRLKSETDAFGRVLRYDYDNADNRTRRSDDTDGVQTAWGYDERNRNDSVTDDSGTTRMSHYRDSRLREIVRPSGTTSAYTYDAAGRSATITHARAGASIAEVRYEYDDNGNRTLERLANGGPERVTTYTYDRADRLATTAVAGGESVAYTLDPVGNRLGETRAGTSTTTITQVFNARDQVQTRTLSGATTGTTTYTWDANGNQRSETEATDVTTNTWDARDRLVGIARTGEPDLTYVYDPEGLRIEAGDGSTGARFRYDAGHLYSEANGANQTVRRYRTNISGPAQKGWLQAAAATLTLFLGMTDAGAIPVERNYLHDALTTPIAIERNDGALAQRSSYDAWGNLASEQVIDAELSAKPNRVGFTGYQLDRATSEEGDTSYYAKARHYGARLGIFRSVDPLQGEAFSPSSLHRYGYGYDNPAAYVDPSGREAICITLGRDCFGHDVTPAEREQQFFTLGAMAAVPVVAAVLVESGTVAAAAWTATRLGGWRWGLAVATTQGAPLVETVAASGLAAAGAGELPPTPFTAVPKLAASASARVLDGELDAARIAASGEIDDVPRLASVASDLPAPTIIRTNSVAIGEASSGGGIAVQSERVQLSVAPAASSGPSARKLGNRQLPKSDRPWVRYQSHATGRDYEEMWQLEQRKVAADARRGGYTVEAKWAGRNDAAFSSSPYNPSHPFYDAERDLKQVQGLLELNRATGGKGVRYAVSNEAARQHFAAFFEANVPDAVASGELQVFHVPGNGM